MLRTAMVNPGRPSVDRAVPGQSKRGTAGLPPKGGKIIERIIAEIAEKTMGIPCYKTRRRRLGSTAFRSGATMGLVPT
jgi:hypothetical protein